MKKGTTTPLPPYCDGGWLEVKLNYYYELSVYWEYVYLMVTRQKFYDGIF